MRLALAAAVLAAAGCFDFESLARLYHADGGEVPDGAAPDGAVPDGALPDLSRAPRDLIGADLIPGGLVFTPQSPCLQLGSSLGLTSLAVFDGDGKNGPDLVVGAQTPKQAIPLFGSAAGTSFVSGSPQPIASPPSAVAGGDFDGDGVPDLLATSLSTVYLLRGTSVGVYASPLVVGNGSAIDWLISGSFDGDNHRDAAWVDAAGMSLTVAEHGTMSSFSIFAQTTGPSPVVVAAGDLNGDAALDLVVANQADDTISVFINDGSGTFTAGSGIALAPSTQQPIRLAVGDLDSDGSGDIVLVTNQQELISIRNNGNGTFQAPVPLLVFSGLGIEDVVIADFNSDGRGDIAYSSYSTDNVYAAAGFGDGSFAPALSWATCNKPQPLVVADFNRDSKPDLAVACAGTTSDVCVFLNATP